MAGIPSHFFGPFPQGGGIHFGGFGIFFPIGGPPPVPVNTAPPTISGAAQVGQTLTVNSNGTWTNSPTFFAYQWFRDGALIFGQIASTYVPVPLDIGHAITVAVIAFNGFGGSIPAFSAPTVAVVAGPSVPVNTAPPVVSGPAQVGQTLMSSTGSWTNSPTLFAYQWKSAGLNVGTNQNSYIPATSDIGNTITCTVTASNGAGPSAPQISGPTVAVVPALQAPVNTALPVVSGMAQVGQTLNTTNGQWSNSPTGFSYQWQSNGVNVGLNQSSYSPVAGDVGNQITVIVTATNSAGSNAATSLPTQAVAPAPAAPVNTFPPAITGPAQVLQTLNVSTGTWANIPTSFAYQWKSGGVNVGLNQNSYVPVVADIGLTILCVVTATNLTGSNSANSNTTAAVVPGVNVPVNNALPVVSGPAQVGQTLNTTNGGWTNSPSSFSYQWKSAGLNVGLNQNSYVPVSGDVGNQITCTVTASNTSGPSTGAQSNPTSAVVPALAAPVNTTPPAVTGTPQVGQILNTTNGIWTNTPSGFAYQWKSGANNATGTGAATANYTCASSDLGNQMSCVVTATNGAGSNSQQSNLTAAVVASTGTLQTLSLSANVFMVGNPQATIVGNVTGTTPGSTVTFSSLSVAGSLQLALVGGTWQVQVGPSAPSSAGTITFGLVETLSGATNSPNTTPGFSVTEKATNPTATYITMLAA